MTPSIKTKITAALALALLAAAPAKAETGFVAEKITAANAARHVQNGPDAIGGIGDWALSNGTLCVIIAGLENEGDFSPRGGTLRDIGFCGRDDDQFVSQQDLVNGSLGQPVGITDIRAATGAGKASLTSLGEYRGLMVETRYTLDAARLNRIGVSKRIWRQDEDAPEPTILATATLNYHSMETFLMNSKTLQLTNGFAQEQFVGRGLLSYTDAARPVDTVMMMSPHDAGKPVSYAMRQISAIKKNEEETLTLPAFALADSSALAFLNLVAPFGLGDGSQLGLAQLAQVPFMDLELGEIIYLEEEILVAPSADVAAFTNMIFDGAPILRGQVKLNGQTARVHIDLANGTPFTQITADAEGKFAAHIPAGDYRLRVLSSAAAPFTTEISVAESGTELIPMTLPKAARIALPRGHAMRLAFHGTINGTGETKNPHFEDSLTGYSVSNGDALVKEHRVSDVHLTGQPHDPTHIYLPDGDYQVYAVRGPEFNITTAKLAVRDAKAQTLRITPPSRAVTTPGHLAADMHVHSAPSLDNAFSSEKRVRTFVAEHGEVMVAAEHDTVFDFNPLVRALGVSDKMIAITGTEVTSTQQTARAPYTIGHMNFFPLTPQPHAHKRGLPNHENRRTRDVLADMQTRFNNPVAQLNHPRDKFALATETLPEDYAELIGDEQFFDHMGVATHPYNPHRPIDSAPNNSLIEKDPISGLRDIDFDVMEIMNGTQDYRPERVDAARQDWLSLVAQGIKLGATANSDSHNKWQIVAMPRNMVRVGRDTITGFSLSRFTEAVREGAFYGTTGPFIDMRLGGALIGQTHKGGTAILKGRIYGPAWSRADKLRVQVNGVTHSTLTLPDNGAFNLTLKFEADAFVTIEAIGEAGEIYQAVYPGFFPYAYSNPIYVDANSDGTWTPPGLQKPATPIE